MIFVLAKDFVKCKISDLTFNECVRTGLQNAIPKLASGNTPRHYDYYYLVGFFFFFYCNYKDFIILFRYSKTWFE